MDDPAIPSVSLPAAFGLNKGTLGLKKEFGVSTNQSFCRSSGVKVSKYLQLVLVGYGWVRGGEIK